MCPQSARAPQGLRPTLRGGARRPAMQRHGESPCAPSATSDRFPPTIRRRSSTSSCRGPSRPGATCWSRCGRCRSTRSTPRCGARRARAGRLEGARLRCRRGGRRRPGRRRRCSGRAMRSSMPASVARQGTNAEFHLVDERIVGRKPAASDWAEAAALPLTAITAWEMLFDRLEIRTTGAGRGAGAADHRRRRRGRVDGGAAGAAADRADRGRHRLAARVARLGAGARGAPRDRPQPAAAGRRSWRSGSARRGSSSRPPTPSATSATIGGADRAAGALRLYRRPETIDPAPFKAQERVDRLGIDVHPAGLRHGGHGSRSTTSCDEVARLVDAGHAAHHAGRAA